MQTFLPEPTFSASAEALDNKRLGKQRSEVVILLKALKQGPTKKVPTKEPTLLPGTLGTGMIFREMATAWYNHPACQMWRGWEQSLIDYGLLVCIEWTRRGFKDACYDKIMQFADAFGPTLWHKGANWDKSQRGGGEFTVYPPWYNEAFIRAHRSNLIRKDPKFYQPKWPGVPDNLPYVWPASG